MFKIKLKNNIIFNCDNNTSILNGAKKNNINLEHSCMSARCSSCKVKVLRGKYTKIQNENILTAEELNGGYILTCNTKPLSNMELDCENLNEEIIKARTLPSKISSIKIISNDVLKVVLRLAPTANFQYKPGQYVNIIKSNIKRSYSIANMDSNNNKLEFFIKNYKNGLMSKYWFNKANENDLLRFEGPLGSFYYRNNNKKDIIFLATGTGIAPIKAILEDLNNNSKKHNNKNIWLFWGVRYIDDLFYTPTFCNLNFKFIPVLSRANKNWKGEVGHIQNIVLNQKINLQNAQVYACGSPNMIKFAKKVLINSLLSENHFFSDAFVESNKNQK